MVFQLFLFIAIVGNGNLIANERESVASTQNQAKSTVNAPLCTLKKLLVGSVIVLASFTSGVFMGPSIIKPEMPESHSSFDLQKCPPCSVINLARDCRWYSGDDGREDDDENDDDYEEGEQFGGPCDEDDESCIFL